MNHTMSVSDSGMARLELRGQTDQEWSILARLFPRPGEKLVIRRDSDGSTGTVVVTVEQTPEFVEDQKTAKIDYTSLTDEDLRTLCAQRGVKVLSRDRPQDMVFKLLSKDNEHASGSTTTGISQPVDSGNPGNPTGKPGG